MFARPYSKVCTCEWYLIPAFLFSRAVRKCSNLNPQLQEVDEAWDPDQDEELLLHGAVHGEFMCSSRQSMCSPIALYLLDLNHRAILYDWFLPADTSATFLTLQPMQSLFSPPSPFFGDAACLPRLIFPHFV